MTLTGIFATLVLLSACNTTRPATTSNIKTPSYYWYTGQSGIIQTNDAMRLQKEVPFKIIFPEYLPDNIITNYPPALVLSPNPDPTIDTKVSIRYQSLISPKEINIEEIASPYISAWAETEQNTLKDYTPFNFAGVTIYEKKSSISASPDKEASTSVLIYSWIWKNINFMVDITGYDQAESRKIVESMIE